MKPHLLAASQGQGSREASSVCTPSREKRGQWPGIAGGPTTETSRTLQVLCQSGPGQGLVPSSFWQWYHLPELHHLISCEGHVPQEACSLKGLQTGFLQDRSPLGSEEQEEKKGRGGFLQLRPVRHRKQMAKRSLKDKYDKDRRITNTHSRRPGFHLLINTPRDSPDLFK